MKKTIMLLLTALCGVWTAAAQDLIVRTDDTRIEARVTEVAPDAVRYKRFSNPDGPTYVLPVDRIRSIRYANGEEEVFSAAEPSESAAAAGSAAPAPQAAQVEPAVSAVPAESAESAERTGNHNARVLHLVDIDSDGIRRLRMLSACPKPQPETRMIYYDHRND